MFDFSYRKKEITYGNLPAEYCNNRGNRKISIHLNGVYSTLSSLTTNIGALHAVLRSSGLKTLSYHGISESVYFADRARVTTILSGLMVSIRLIVRVGEAVEGGGQVIYTPGAGSIPMPDAGTIIFPK